ncbi:red chlorophyll catabolite reductase, chloroplastic isoform X2 [Cornus florida]|uniref:red chlorophyll catabolite reductase, chloroplastic isoform X2 n=1 Tax=Cornus florida TaxID=4283 RepID=UPI002899B218|nr:red chlorophyll catabolite reductase, chloroplastic isoform X2 [Cornus florida]
MAVMHCCAPLPPLHCTTLYSIRRPPTSRMSCSFSSHMDQQNEIGKKKFTDFPYVSVPQRNLMVELVSMLETRLNPYLQPCNLPPDVQYYHNQTGTAQASLHIRSGLESSPIYCMLGSWFSSAPTSEMWKFTSLSAFMNTSTDSPHWIIDLMQDSPTCLSVLIDLTPRKDPVVNPGYADFFYDHKGTTLDIQRQLFEGIPEANPTDLCCSVTVRSVLSPAAICFTIETGDGGAGRLEEIIRDNVRPIAKRFGWIGVLSQRGRWMKLRGLI